MKIKENDLIIKEKISNISLLTTENKQMKIKINSLIFDINNLKQNYQNEFNSIHKKYDEQNLKLILLDKVINEKTKIEKENIELKNKINKLMEILKELEEDNNIKEKTIEKYQNNIHELNNFINQL